MATHQASAARWMGMALGAVLAACGSGAGGGGILSEDRERSGGGGGGNGGGGGGGGTGDGAALYGASCADCHGALASSDVAGASSGSIQAAINGNVGGMGSILLTAAQLDAIAVALGGPGGGGGGGGGTEEAALYEANCMGCHGALASSDVRGESAEDIAEAIADDEGGMGSLTLTMAQLESIAAALGGGDDGDDDGEDDGDDGDDDDEDEGSDDLVMALRAAHRVGGPLVRGTR